VYRTVDLNADGDANDAGEATVWLDLQTLNSASSAFDISFIGNVAYVTDTNGGTPDTVYRIEDLNGDGDASDAGEASVFISETNSFGAPMDIANAAQGNSLLTYTWIGNESDPPRIYRLTDLNDSHTIDSASEAVEVWNWDYLPEGFAASVGFSITSDGDDIILTSNGGVNERNVIRLSDLNADGDYKDEGEQIIALSNAIDAGTANRPRAVSYYSDGTVIAHPLVYKESGAGVVFAGDLAIADADSTLFSGAEIEIVGGFADGDTLVFRIPEGSDIQGEYDAENGVLILAGAGSAAEYEAILRSISFEARVDDPSGDLRHLSITVYDERGLAGPSVTVSTTLDTEIDPDFVTHYGGEGDDALQGDAQNDRFISYGGDDELDGGDGYDIAIVGGDAGFTATATGWTVESSDGTDALTDVEKVIDADGHPTWLNKPGELVDGGSSASTVTLDETVNVAGLAEAGWIDQGGGVYGKICEYGVATLNTGTLTVSYLLLQALANPLEAGEFVQEVLGIPLASGEGRVRFAIAGTNDAPALGGDLSASIDAGETYTITTADLSFSDIDDVAADVTFTVTDLSHGVVKVEGVVQTSFSGTDVAAGLVTFQHDGSDDDASFDVAVEDGDEDVSGPDSDTFDFAVSFGAPAPDVVGTKKGDNPLNGTIGSEDIFGLKGNDTIHADLGDDVLIGGRGHDILFGEGGADRFDFNSWKESGRGVAKRDVIMDFEQGVDTIDLSSIDANSHRRGNQSFKFIEGQFTGKAGQLHVVAKGGDLYRVEGDVNGDGKADFHLDVHSTAALEITDFIR
jgi:Ca2+-binding RTX toxin-like protein